MNTNFKLGISTLFLLLGNSILSQNKTFGGLPQLNINKILSEKWRLNLKLNLEINFMNLLRNLKILINFRTLILITVSFSKRIGLGSSVAGGLLFVQS